MIARISRHVPLEFAPLQGPLAASLGFSHFAESGGGSMVLLREIDGKSFTGSDALITLCGLLGGLWRLFQLAALIPKPIRDAGYRWFARHRYRWMGRADACALPDGHLAKRLRD